MSGDMPLRGRGRFLPQPWLQQQDTDQHQLSLQELQPGQPVHQRQHTQGNGLQQLLPQHYTQHEHAKAQGKMIPSGCHQQPVNLQVTDSGRKLQQLSPHQFYLPHRGRGRLPPQPQFPGTDQHQLPLQELQPGQPVQQKENTQGNVPQQLPPQHYTQHQLVTAQGRILQQFSLPHRGRGRFPPQPQFQQEDTNQYKLPLQELQPDLPVQERENTQENGLQQLPPLHYTQHQLLMAQGKMQPLWHCQQPIDLQVRARGRMLQKFPPHQFSLPHRGRGLWILPLQQQLSPEKQ